MSHLSYQLLHTAILLRGQDSNLRPDGYEPPALPTAPPRYLFQYFKEPLCIYLTPGNGNVTGLICKIPSVRPAGLEPATSGSGVRRSDPLSYGRVPVFPDGFEPPTPWL